MNPDLVEPLVMAVIVASIPLWRWREARHDRRLLKAAAERGITATTRSRADGLPVGVISAQRVVGLDVVRHGLMALQFAWRKEWPALSRWFAHQRRLTMAQLVEEAARQDVDALVAVRWTECRLGRFRPRLVAIVYATGVKVEEDLAGLEDAPPLGP